MKIFLCFLLIIFTEGKDDSEFDVTLNKLLIPILVCFKEREGATCPPDSTCGKSTIQCKNTTQCCVSTSDPLTRFYLFTPRNKENPEFLHNCGGRLPANTFFDKNLKTEVFIHGLFDGPCRTAAWREIKDQLFEKGNYNVILVDWSRENFPEIHDALKANKFVGRRVACVIENIMIQTGVTGNNFHLVGHSMGAHISGLCGQHINKCKFSKLRRITALDPCNIGYYKFPPNKRLSRGDACCVDAVHTDMGECFPEFNGYQDNIGHADFYPNGGSVQLSCYLFLLESFLKGDIFSAVVGLLPSFCSHDQAVQYYKISINSKDQQFIGVECKDYDEFDRGACKTCGKNDSSCAVMGMDFEDYNGSCSGCHQYFLKTSITCPYYDNSYVNLNGFPENSAKEHPGRQCSKNRKKG